MLELAEPFPISLPAISRHLRVLTDAGLVERGRSAQYRPAALRAAPMQEAADWLDRFRAYWEASFERLDAVLGEITASDRKDD